MSCAYVSRTTKAQEAMGKACAILTVKIVWDAERPREWDDVWLEARDGEV